MSNNNPGKHERAAFEPQRVIELRDREMIKAYVHPTRITILNLLGREKRTVSTVAKELGVHPANITHHFKLLEKNGLIRLVERRDIGKTIEKYYRASAHSYIVKLKDETSAGKKALALSILKDDLAVAISSIRDGDQRLVMALLRSARLEHKDASLFAQRLRKLVDDFAGCDSEQGTPYNISLSLYPNDTGPVPQKEIIIS